MEKKTKIETEKEYYRLWIEYLKRNGDYKKFCQWCIKKRKKPNLPVPLKFQKSRSAPKELFNCRSFCNIHDPAFSFDEWFKQHKEKLNYMDTHKSPKAIEDFTEHIGGYINVAIDSFKRHFKREPSIQELKEWLTNHVMKEIFYNSIYLMVSVTDDTVIEQFKKLVKEKRKDPRIIAYDLFRKKNWRPILKYEIIDEIKTYLNVYDFVTALIEKGTIKRDAIKKAIEHFEGESIDYLKTTGKGNFKGDRYDSTLRKYNMYFDKAKQIIKNSEHGFFPLYGNKTIIGKQKHPQISFLLI